VIERLKGATMDDILAMVGRFEPGGTAALPFAPAARAEARPSSGGALRAGLDSIANLIRSRAEPVAPPSTSIPAEPASIGVEPQRTPVIVTEAPSPTDDGPPTPGPVEAGAELPVATSQEMPAETPAPIAEPNVNASTTDWPELIRRAERLGEPEPIPSIPVIEEMAPATPEDESSRTARSFAGGLDSARGQAQRATQAMGRALGVTLAEANRAWRKLLARMLPEGMLQKEGMFSVPTSVQIGIAVTIPLVIVGIAAFVYIQRGRAQQFDDALTQAKIEIATGRAMPDPLSARPNWENALGWLDQAEALKPRDAQIAELRQEAQGKLDELDWVTRLNYQPLVIGGVGRDVSLKQILPVGSDVYALDARSNRVLRLTPTTNNTGYGVDADFECSSGAVGGFTIGTLIDIGLVPGPNAIGTDAVIALDTTGGLLYCAPGLKPLATYLPAPDTSWIRPSALEVYADRLYVLDPGSNEVWQFQASGGAFNQPPTHYFTGVAYDLQDVIEFTIAGGDLFLLRKDGRVALCSRPATGEAATCAEVVQYTDQRLGRTSGDHLADVAAPTRLAYDPPPEPSLYLLDPASSGVYQLSLKLVLVKQFRPQIPFFDPVTAVAIDPSKQIYLAAGDNVYRAQRP
jgi:hypothetical protein